MKINNTRELDGSFIWKDDLGLVTQYLGSAAGSGRIYVNIDRVPPRALSTKYHSHSQQEEFFLILGGSGMLRLDGEEHNVCKGDFISKQAGRGIAHQFYNNGEETLEILDVGTVDSEDIIFYPDEGIYLVKSGGERHVFGKSGEIEGWTSDPNTK